jgi:hypothetical protein
MNWPCRCGERAEERQVKSAKIGMPINGGDVVGLEEASLGR